MTDDTTSPIRRAAVEAVCRFHCCGDVCSEEARGSKCRAWGRYAHGIGADLSLYAEKMGRTDEAAQIRRMADGR
jgi:hypothetical protein